MSPLDLPAGHTMNKTQRRGCRGFWSGHALRDLHMGDVRIGWWKAYARAFAQGALEAALDRDLPTEWSGDRRNPHARDTPAHEAWAAGYDQSADLA